MRSGKGVPWPIGNPERMHCLASRRRDTTRKHFFTPLPAVDLSTLVEPVHAQLSTECQNTNGTRNRSSNHSRPFLHNNHCTWRAGEPGRATMPPSALVIGVVLLILSVFSSPSFAAADCNWMTVGSSVATSVWASGPALSSDGLDTWEASTSQAGRLT